MPEDNRPKSKRVSKNPARMKRGQGPKDLRTFDYEVGSNLSKFHAFLINKISNHGELSEIKEAQLADELLKGLDMLTQYIREDKNLLLEGEFAEIMRLLFGPGRSEYNIDALSLKKIAILKDFLKGDISERYYVEELTELMSLENNIHILIAYASGKSVQLSEEERATFEKFLNQEFFVKQIHINPKKQRQSYAVILAYYLKKNAMLLSDDQINVIFQDLNMSRLLLGQDMRISELLSSESITGKNRAFLEVYSEFSEAKHSQSPLIRPLEKFMASKPEAKASGSFGEVFEFEHEGQTYAVKRLKASDISDRMRFSLSALRAYDESKTHSMLTAGEDDPKGLPKHYGMFYIKDELYIITEFCHKGSLLSSLRGTDLSRYPATLNKGAMNLLKGLAYMHERGFIHNDIAARNILVRQNNDFVHTDFGLTLDTNLEYRIENVHQMPFRWSPDLRKAGELSPMSDAYALAVTFYELYTHGIQPFPYLSVEQVKSKSSVELCEMLMSDTESADVPEAISNIQKVLLYAYLIEEKKYAVECEMDTKVKNIDKLMLKIKDSVKADELIQKIEAAEPFERVQVIHHEVVKQNLWSIESALVGEEAPTHEEDTDNELSVSSASFEAVYQYEGSARKNSLLTSYEFSSQNKSDSTSSSSFSTLSSSQSTSRSQSDTQTRTKEISASSTAHYGYKDGFEGGSDKSGMPLDEYAVPNNTGAMVDDYGRSEQPKKVPKVTQATHLALSFFSDRVSRNVELESNKSSVKVDGSPKRTK